MKIIELLNKIAKGEEAPNKIKYKNNTYEDEPCYLTYQATGEITEEEFKSVLNSEIEILEEVEDKEYEDIEEIGILKYCENEVESILHRKIDALIRNQKYILERLDK